MSQIFIFEILFKVKLDYFLKPFEFVLEGKLKLFEIVTCGVFPRNRGNIVDITIVEIVKADNRKFQR